jgi:hypothetical protein
MTDKIVDFETAKQRRVIAGIGEDDARFEETTRQLIRVMGPSELSDNALIVATLGVLLATLEAGGRLSFDEAKAEIVSRVPMFR